MAIKKYGPTTPGRRGMTVTDYSVLSKVAPERSLLEPMSAIRAAATAPSIVSSTSSVRRPISPLPLRLSSTIRTAAHSSLWSSTPTASRATSLLPMA